jgi:hypothetical protein
MNRFRLIPPVLAAAVALAIPAAAAPLKRAEVTRVFNEVKLLPAAAASRDARVGDTVEGRTAVRTGERSRTELRFADQTLSRLGANSQFSFENGTRNLALDNGVLFLQVPKNAGGARIRTAAVTAAVTGTTILLEFVPGQMIKIIVIEGTLDVYFPDNPKKFITLKAGQMLIMHPDAREFPKPVDVDLARLVKTSKLIDPAAFDALGDEALEASGQAIADQERELRSGRLRRTNLVLPGRGSTLLVLNREEAITLHSGVPAIETRPAGEPEPVPPQDDPGGGSPPHGGGNGGGTEPPVGPPLLAGPWTIDQGTTVADFPPYIVTPIQQGPGEHFLAEVDGQLLPWLFGAPGTIVDSTLDEALLGTSLWNAFLLDAGVTLGGTPQVDFADSSNLLLASPGVVGTLAQSEAFMNLGQLENFGLFSQSGINFNNSGFFLDGSSTNVLLHADGGGGTIELGAGMQLGDGGLHTFSKGDTNLNSTFVQAGYVTSRADGKITVGSTFVESAHSVKLDATGTVSVQNSTIAVNNSGQISDLLAGAGEAGSVLIQSRGGAVSLTGSTAVNASGPGGTIDILAPAGPVEITGQPGSPDGGTGPSGGVQLTASTRITVKSGGAQPSINVAYANFMAPVIDLLAEGNNARITLANATLASTTATHIHALGVGSLVEFAGPVTLSGPNVWLKGQTVRVLPGVDVNAFNVGNLRIDATAHQYNIPDFVTNGNFGNILTGSGTIIDPRSYDGVPLGTAN